MEGEKTSHKNPYSGYGPSHACRNHKHENICFILTF